MSYYSFLSRGASIAGPWENQNTCDHLWRYVSLRHTTNQRGCKLGQWVRLLPNAWSTMLWTRPPLKKGRRAIGDRLFPVVGCTSYTCHHPASHVFCATVLRPASIMRYQPNEKLTFGRRSSFLKELGPFNRMLSHEKGPIGRWGWENPVRGPHPANLVVLVFMNLYPSRQLPNVYVTLRFSDYNKIKLVLWKRFS